MISTPCLVCGGRYERSKLPGLLQCQSCEFTTADVEVSQEMLNALYGRDYFHGGEYRDYLEDRPIIERQARQRLARLGKYLGDSSQKTLFEIGSAYGFFLLAARQRFAAVEGIDISSEAVSYAAGELGLHVHRGDFLQHELRVKPDALCLWDTVEHLHYPDLYIEKAASCLNRGGLIAITTGDIGSVVARWRGKRWRQIHPPTHLHYFSRDTLTRLLRNYGFQLRYCRSEGVYRSVDTMAYIVLNIKYRRPTLYAALKRSGALGGTVYLNFGDIVFIIAERT